MSEESLWRPAYEAYSGAAWFATSATAVYLLSKQSLPPEVLCGTGYYAAVMGLCRWLQALHVWRHRFALEGRRIDWISGRQVQAKMRRRPGHVWLGWGFEWTRLQAQRFHDMERADITHLRVPGAWLWKWLLGRGRARMNKGNPLLHAVEPVEKDIYVPLSDLQGHLFVPATTGAIKTRLLALLAVQAIRRKPHEAVVVIDPKGDTELRELLRAECRAAGRERDFAYFHPAFPQESVRIDPLANWTRTTEVASRIAALIPSESGNDPWSAFGWRVLHAVVEGCLATHGERPTLAMIRRYVEGGVDRLLHNTLVKRFEERGIDWREALRSHPQGADRKGPPGSRDTVALVTLYKNTCRQTNGVDPLDGLISMFEHNREHAQKMLASLIPVLTMLTAGDLGGLLSPDRDDPSDTRPVLNGASIVDAGAVMYIGLDALSDAVVASAISSIFMADLTAHAGARFNLGISEPGINVFVDEANEAVNIPFIQMLNKARSAGYKVVFFSQTFSDFVAKLGSEALARQVLGNANSIIAGRTKDGVTAEYVMEDFGKTMLMGLQQQTATSTAVDGEILNYSGTYGERHTETPSEIVPQAALSRLPDLEYFASFSGSRIVKGRIPLVRSAAT